MSVIYSTQKDSFVSNNGGLYAEKPKPPPTPPGMVKKSTMYIIVALSVVVTSMMFASTVTVVYLIARGENNSDGGGKAGHIADVAGNQASPSAGITSLPLGQGQTTKAYVQNENGNQAGTSRPAGTAAPPVGHTLSPAATTRYPENAPAQSQGSRSDLPSTVTTFTRWGRTECTNNSEALYTGYTAGSRYNYYGGTSTVLCLPNEPQYGNTYRGMSGSFVYGSEYNNANSNLRAVFGENLLEQDIPCALCEVTGSSAMMMFPARTECYNGWKKQYSGYLMTSHEAYNKSMDIVCMDKDPEVVPASSANNNGALFYFVEAKGQILYPKGKYWEGFELTCVVCTK